MSYSTLLEDENIEQRFLVILQPRRKVTGWTLFSGFVYKTSWSFGKPSSVEVDSIVQTEAASTSLSVSQWYWDETNDEIYLRVSDSSDPDTRVVTLTYPLYCSTASAQDTIWYKDPLDNTTEQVFYDPIISKAPSIKARTDDALFGFLPVQSSSVELHNFDHVFENHVYESSFNKATIKIYHFLGDELAIDNGKLVYDGIMSNVVWTTDKIVIKTIDRLDEFNQEFRNTNSSFYSTSLFPSLNPQFIGKPIRYVYGRVEGFVPVNTGYVEDSPSTSDNRQWAVCGEQTGLGEITRTVVGSSSTTSRTYLDFTEGLNVGDTVWLDKAVDKYFVITAIDRVASYIDHDVVAGIPSAGDTVKRGFISRINIEQDGIIYTALYKRDYTCTNALAGGVSGFVFESTLEANLGMASTLSPNDKVSCTVYGRVNDLTAGGPTFGANHPTNSAICTNNIANPVMIIYDILKTRMGMAESRINLTQFASVRTTTASEGLGFAIPSEAQSVFPSYKNVILDILRTSLIRFFLDSDNKWSIALLGPLATSTETIDYREIIDAFSYDFNYDDVVSDVLVQYAKREIGANLNDPENSTQQVTATSLTAKHVHKVNKQETFESLHFNSSDAQVLANRLSYALGERDGRISFRTKNKLFLSLLNDTITVQSEKLPGFSYVQDTDRTVDGSIVSIDRGLNGIFVEIQDQKGIEDNSGSW